MDMIIKLTLKTGSEAMVFYALQMPLPHMFHTPEFNDFASDGLQTALNQVPTYHHWSNDCGEWSETHDPFLVSDYQGYHDQAGHESLEN
jgi:hypothetical protein